MGNSIDATINGSKANSVNKRSKAATAQLSVHEDELGAATAKKRRTVFYKHPPEPASDEEIEAEGEEEEEEIEAEGELEEEEIEAEGEQEEEDEKLIQLCLKRMKIRGGGGGGGEEDDENEHEEMAPENEGVTGTKARVSGGMNGKRSISMTLTDPDALDCPICFLSLTIPVFQCENGHIACETCSTIISQCPSCTCPIGNNRCRALEKVLESVEVPCPNARYGCNDSLIYSKLGGHESICIYTPCSCPLRACKFIGFFEDVYTHFSSRHNSSAKRIDFCSPKPISLKKNQRFLYLLEKTEGTIFVVNHHFCGLGSAVNVIRIAPVSSARRFHYELMVMGGETSIKLESVADNIPNWDPSTPLKTFLLVPRDFTDSCGQLRLEVCIKDW